MTINARNAAVGISASYHLPGPQWKLIAQCASSSHGEGGPVPTMILLTDPTCRCVLFGDGRATGDETNKTKACN